MAERPVFVPAPDSPELVQERFFPLQWNSGFAVVQKEKNIRALREVSAAAGLAPLLEISTKSDRERGRHMSAFHMTVPTEKYGRIKLELAFQGSKVFEHGGPYTDLFTKDDKQIGEAKRDARLTTSGKLVRFEFEGCKFPLEPKTAFYDWLYLNFLNGYRDWAPKLFDYAGFTDVEFNPHRSVNCQARSAALFVSMLQRGILDEALQSPSAFLRVLADSKYRPQLRGEHFIPRQLFATSH